MHMRISVLDNIVLNKKVFNENNDIFHFSFIEKSEAFCHVPRSAMMRQNDEGVRLCLY